MGVVYDIEARDAEESRDKQDLERIFFTRLGEWSMPLTIEALHALMAGSKEWADAAWHAQEFQKRADQEKAKACIVMDKTWEMLERIAVLRAKGVQQ